MLQGRQIVTCLVVAVAVVAVAVVAAPVVADPPAYVELGAPAEVEDVAIPVELQLDRTAVAPMASGLTFSGLIIRGCALGSVNLPSCATFFGQACATPGERIRCRSAADECERPRNAGVFDLVCQ